MRWNLKPLNLTESLAEIFWSFLFGSVLTSDKVEFGNIFPKSLFFYGCGIIYTLVF